MVLKRKARLAITGLAMLLLGATISWAQAPAKKETNREELRALRRVVRRTERQLLAWSTGTARETLAPMLQAKMANAQIKMLEGRILEQEGKAGEALEAYQAASDLEPKNPEPHLYLGGVHEAAKRPEQARTHYQAAFNRATNWTRREPETADAYYALGQATQGLGHLDEATSAYNRALELEPEAPLPALYLGTIYYRQENWPQARKMFDQALLHNKNIAMAYFFRGITYGKLKKKAAMMADLDHFVAMAPNAPEAETARAILSAVR